MAGSNGSPTQRGGQPPQWPAESPEQARALEFERWQQQRQQAGRAPAQPIADPFAQGYAQPAHPQAGAPPQPGYDQPAPHPQAGWGHDAAGYQQPPPPGSPAYAPQFDQFAQPPAPRYEAVADPFARYEPAAAQPAAYADPRAPQQGWPAQHDPRAFDPQTQAYADPRYAAPAPQQPAHHAYPGQAGAEPRADVQSWDLSHYAPGQIPQGYAGGPPPAQQAGWQQPAPAPAGEPQWQQPSQAYWPGQAGQPPGPHGGYEPPFHAQQAAPAGHAYDAQAGAMDAGYDSDDMEPPEDERRGPSTLVIVAALVGAIVAGGGLAYGYKMIGGGVRDKGKPPVLKADAAPAKTRPQSSGGMRVEHSDKKFLNRLGNGDEPPVPTSLAETQPTGDVDGGAKKVPTITINVNKDNTITPKVVQAAPADAGVPGLIIDSPPPPAGNAAMPIATAPPAPPARPVVRMPPPPPPVVRTAEVQAPAAAVAVPQEDTEPPKARRIAVPKKRTAAVRDDLMAPKATEGDRSALGSTAAPASPAPRVATSGSGFVAVLASKRSRQDAIAAFPDLHQQYPDLLGGKTPDVREIDLRDKGGHWYRLVVGPPGSRQAAAALCTKLKERGMKDCWAAPY